MNSYHNSIIELIAFILGKGHEYLSDIDSGNAYDKIIRNYHQFNIKGEKVYRNITLMQTHYRYTQDAWQNRTEIKELYFEHLVPLKIIKKELQNLIGTNFTREQIKMILEKTEIAVLTKQQAKLLDKKYKSDLPSGGESRLAIMKYEIEVITEQNSIFKIN